MSHQHLTIEERSQIKALLSTGAKQKEIARTINRPPCTISREIKRNSGRRGYRYQQADRLAKERRSLASVRPCKWTPKLEAQVVIMLEGKLSPDQISGRLKACHDVSISHERIYQFVYEDRRSGGWLYTHLRHGGKRYNYKRGSKSAGRGCIPHRVDISKRPKVVDQKSRLGDWEGDLIIGKNHQGAILSLVDRKSKFTLLERLTSKEANRVVDAVLRGFKTAPRQVCHTITYDNGKEFSQHEAISRAVNAKSYFATPYHSWERGLNEHTNGLVRQYLPKKTNFLILKNNQVKFIQNQLNDRPRKVLGYRTPREVFMGLSRPPKIAIDV